jgi:triacylglycerol lipase
MATGIFDVQRAVALGDAVAYAYHVYDIQAGNQDQFPNAALPAGYEQVGEIYVNDSLFDQVQGSVRKDALKSSLDEIFNTDKPFGVLAYSTADQAIIIAIRGTQTAFEWIHDGEFWKADFTSSNGTPLGQAEVGFVSLYKSCTAGAGTDKGKAIGASTIVEFVRDFVQGDPVNRKVTHIDVTGHSLGAAIATLLAFDLAESVASAELSVGCTTFASPLVGDKKFAGEFDESVEDSWRIVNAPDIVPMLPPMFVGFAHVATLYPLNSYHLTKHTLPCWHALETYLYLLDPQGHPLQGECEA